MEETKTSILASAQFRRSAGALLHIRKSLVAVHYFFNVVSVNAHGLLVHVRSAVKQKSSSSNSAVSRSVFLLICQDRDKNRNNSNLNGIGSGFVL